MSPKARPPMPPPIAPSPAWAHCSVYEGTKRAIASLPLHFSTDTYIEGISATDIFNLNATLGATIEEQVVSTLNRLRGNWDRDGRYCLYGFVRQPQTFPDVVLRSTGPEHPFPEPIILGVEMKGWYILSKEREPSFRYTVTPDACAEADLLVCVPWVLKNVLSGPPIVLEPYVIPAKQAALLRNYCWQHVREAKSDTGIRSPKGPLRPYPAKSDSIADVPASDTGGNFGRYARTGIMDDYLARMLRHPVCGIPAGAWVDFFKLFTESTTSQDIAGSIAKLRARLASGQLPPDVAPPTARVYLQILDVIEQAL